MFLKRFKEEIDDEGYIESEDAGLLDY